MVTKTVTEVSLGPGYRAPVGLGVGPDRALWFTESTPYGKVARMDPVSHAIEEFAVPSGDSDCPGIVAGPDGNLWFTEFGAWRVARVVLAGRTPSGFASG